jgi:glycosyltransferase involved in cell wall biosynthesis
MAAGKPVVAYGRGGALETVVEGVTGTFFYEPTPKDVKEALLRLISMEKSLDPAVIRARAEQFSAAVFRRKLKAFVAQAWDEHRAANGLAS